MDDFPARCEVWLWTPANGLRTEKIVLNNHWQVTRSGAAVVGDCSSAHSAFTLCYLVLSAHFARLNGTAQSVSLNDASPPDCTNQHNFDTTSKCLLHISACPESPSGLYAITVSICFPDWHCKSSFAIKEENSTPVHFVCSRWSFPLQLFHRHSCCCTPKLKVNSAFWPHPEGPLICGKSHPV